jgi:RNA polymerase sigma-70 factor (ECF subfamily)
MIQTKDTHTITRMLTKWSDRDPEAWDKLVPQVYEALKQKAGQLLSGQAAHQTLHPTLLVHEIYLEFQSLDDVKWQSRQHFYAVAALTMRQFIVDNIRRKNSGKRAGHPVFVTTTGLSDGTTQDNNLDLLDLDDALNKLEARYPDCCQIVQLRFFAGLTVPEVADVLGISERKVYYHWNWAKSWLYKYLYG